MKKGIISGFLVGASTALMGQYWSPMGSGMNGTLVSTIALEPATGQVYAGGAFSTAGGTSAPRAAIWDGSSWSALDGGFDNPVRVLQWFGDTLWAGGDFTQANGTSAFCISYRDPGGAWHNLGDGMVKTGQHAAVASVYDIVSFQGKIHVGGVFDVADNNSANYVARWDDSTWTGLGTGIGGVSWVYALEVFQNELYVAGNFTSAGGQTCKYIAKWDGSAWSPVGSGMNGSVFDLVIHNGELYACGAFTTAGGQPANRVAKWDGTVWTAVGGGMDTDVNCLESFDGDLYAGGIFQNAEGNPASRFARWNGTQWDGVTSGTSGLVYVLTADTAQGLLYAGGSFLQADGMVVNRVAVYSPLVGRFEPVADAPSIFPQPANSSVYIQLPKNPLKGAEFHIADLNGKTVQAVWSVEGQTLRVERGLLPPGMYLFEIRDEETQRVSTGKIVWD